MEETRYGLRVEIAVGYERAVDQATAALKEQGFGVLTTIDVQQTLKQKRGRDFRKYVILGACNPPLADRALHAELEVGLLLPCNVVVYEVSLAGVLCRPWRRWRRSASSGTTRNSRRLRRKRMRGSEALSVRSRSGRVRNRPAGATQPVLAAVEQHSPAPPSTMTAECIRWGRDLS